MDKNATFEHAGHKLNLFAGPDEEKEPVKSNIVVKEIALSASAIQPGEPLVLTAQLRGEEIAHIYSVAYLVQGEFAYGPVYQQYCIASVTKSIRGVSYPKWEDEIQLSETILLELPLLMNAKQECFAFAYPQRYMAQDSDQQYQIPGWYRAFGKEEKNRARLSFEARGKLLSIVASSSKKEGAPVRKVTPKSGDTFTPLARRFRPQAGLLSTNADDFVLADEIALSWDVQRVCQPALEGAYYVGILVEDLQGHHYRQVLPLYIDAMAA